MAAAWVLLVATSTSVSIGPGQPNLRPSDSALAAMPPIVPIVTADGAMFPMVTIVPIVTAVGTILQAVEPEPYDTGSTIVVAASPPSEAVPVSEVAPPVAVEVRPPPQPRAPRTDWSFGARLETGFFSPEDINADIIRTSGRGGSFAIFGGLGVGAEYRLTPIVALSGTLSYLLVPPITVGTRTLYMHSPGASIGARFYVPTTESLDVAMGAEGTIRWIGYDDKGGVAAGFVWRFGVQFKDEGLPAVLATLYFRRSKATDRGFELDMSGIGAMFDFFWDL